MKEFKKLASEIVRASERAGKRVTQRGVSEIIKERNLGIPIKSQKEIYRESKEQEKKRAKRTNRYSPLSVMSFQLKERIEDRLSERLYKEWCFRTGGFENFFRVILTTDKTFDLDIQSVSGGRYSSRCSYQKMNYEFTLKLPASHTFEIRDGKLLVFPKDLVIHENAYFRWFEQGRGMSLKEVKGYYLKGKLVGEKKMKKPRVRKLKILNALKLAA